MCGLVFTLQKQKHEQALAKLGNQAMQALKHRGPDAKGQQQGDGWLMGHQRLSVLDLQASQQPMSDPSGRFSLAYNGEIYNHASLRARLCQHWSFQTMGDTEVLLAGLLLEGETFQQQLNGMWAFALWDRLEQKLLLGRDRFGKKPLYYQQTRTAFSCASELPALRCLALSSWQEDLHSTADYLRYGFPLPSYTMYEQVFEVLPGHSLTWQLGQDCRQQAYWQLTPAIASSTEKQAIEALQDDLSDAVHMRMHADVAVGAFLSGGIDSSLILSLMSDHAPAVQSFTIGFQEKSYDERAYARIMAKQCHSHHHEQCLSMHDPTSLLSLLDQHLGQPFADVSLFPTAAVSRLTAQHVKVALSGDGADELFSGYQRYTAMSLLRWYSRLPRLLRRGIKTFVQAFPEPSVHHSASFLKKAHLFLATAERQQTYIAPSLYDDADFQNMFPHLHGLGHTLYGMPDCCEPDDIHSMMLRDVAVYLPQDILCKVDRAAMASSLEVRSPFLDYRLVEKAFSLPISAHRHGLQGKRLLKKAFSSRLPAAIWKRRKQGFSVPVHLWFRQGLGDELAVYLQGANAMKKTGQHLLLEHQQGKRDHGLRLWNLYAYLRWQHAQA